LNTRHLKSLGLSVLAATFVLGAGQSAVAAGGKSSVSAEVQSSATDAQAQNRLGDVKVNQLRDGRYQITWSSDNPFDAVRVYWSTSPKDIQITGSILVYAKSKDGSVIVDNPASGKRVYFYVEGVQNTGIAMANRLLDIGKIYNFRDLGGYETVDGKRVKWGKLFRSSQLADLTPDELEKMEALHIDVIADFRSDSEIESLPDTVIPNTKYVRLNANVSSVYNAADLAATFNSGNFAELGKPGEAMTKLNKALVDEVQPGYVDMFDLLASDEVNVFLQHCTAGKDRTGLGAALILLALGVPEETVIDDYQLSQEYTASMTVDYMSQVKQYVKDPETLEVLESVLNIDRSYIKAAIDEMKIKSGSVANYIKNDLKVSDEQLQILKDKFLE